MSWMANYEPLEVPVSDGRGWEGTVWIQELSEKDIEDRTKFLAAPGSEEKGRRGRSSRGQRSSVNVERLRKFNFERSIVAWDFVFPDKIWDKARKQYVEHPDAGKPVPVKREYINQLSGRVAEQIDDAINDLNAPPEDLPEVRDEETGEVLEPAEDSPTQPS